MDIDRDHSPRSSADSADGRRAWGGDVRVRDGDASSVLSRVNSCQCAPRVRDALWPCVSMWLAA